jgi:hypothetical protein
MPRASSIECISGQKMAMQYIRADILDYPFTSPSDGQVTGHPRVDITKLNGLSVKGTV